ncbi:MAG TPA: aminoglycoside adenylyltransferase domain-containing protein [Candidatus Limnocylindrales bacterium]|nr:aminoglycoside adenylyltransferase domain-containing protein [Candidatus Limnocylindrales bacterium]
MTSPAGPTPFPELNGVLAAFVDAVAGTLRDNLVGVCLVGSFALGGADENSDVDFMVILERDVTADELAELQAMHGRFYDLPSDWARHFDGSHAPADLWRRPPAPGRPPDDDRTPEWVDPGTGAGIGDYPFLYLDNGARLLVRSAHDNTLVVRWVMREHGVALAGAPPDTLIDPIDDDALRTEVLGAMREWGSQILRAPEWVSSLWRQAYLVVSYSRMLQTIETARIHPKAAGARWGMANLDPRWRGLIERAWGERAEPWRKVHVPADPDEVTASIDFVRYAIDEGRRRMADGG